MANLNSVFRPASESPAPNGSNPSGPGPNAPPSSAPATATDVHRHGSPTHRPHPPRSGSPAPSDVGSMPELETVSDSSADEEHDDESDRHYWRDDDDPPWSSEDEDDEGEEDEGRPVGVTRVELERVVEAIQNITIADSGGVDGEEPESHYTHHEGWDSGQGFREPPPPLSAFNSEEDEEAVPIEFLTALATMSGMIGTGPESEHAGGEGLIEEEDTLAQEPLPPVPSRPAETASLVEPSNLATTSYVEVPPSPSLILPVGSDAVTGSFPSSDILPSVTQSSPSPSITDVESATATSTSEPPVEARASADNQPIIEPPTDPPFMTDGRGRVVWSRAGSKSGPSSPASPSVPSHGRSGNRTAMAPAGTRRLTEHSETEAGEGERMML